jgi:predicted TIM-barrel fold metal-dependent hydrolase
MLPFHDVNCRVGPRMGTASTVPQKPGAVSGQLQDHGIHWAVCTHSWSEEYDALEGNRRMAQVSQEHPDLRTCASILPPSSDAFPGPADLPEHLEEVGAMAARISPRSHGFEAFDAVIGESLRVVAELGLPLLVALSEIGWRDLDGLLAAHPDLVVVLEGVGYREDRTLFPMMAAHPNLRLETSRYVGHEAVEAVARRFGSHRLLFGSGLPSMPPGPALSRILFADLPDGAKAAIAGGNLMELIGAGDDAP